MEARQLTMVRDRLNMREVFRDDQYVYFVRHIDWNGRLTCIRGKLCGSRVFEKQVMKTIDLITLMSEEITRLKAK